MFKWIAAAAVTICCGSGETFLIKSTDGGRTWIDIDPGPPHQQLLDLQVTGDGSRLYALTVTRTAAQSFDRRRDMSVVTSADGGRSWRTLDALGVSNGFAAMAAAPSDAGTVYVTRLDPSKEGAGMTLVRTTDAGITADELKGAAEAMRPFTTFPSSCNEEPAFFGVHPASALTVFMAFDCSGDNVDPYHTYILSRDGGSTWSVYGELEWLSIKAGTRRTLQAAVTQLLGPPGERSLLYSRNQDAGGKFHLAKSTDGGDTWSAPLLRDIHLAALDSQTAAVLLASKMDGTLWRSADRAESWDQLGNWLPLDRLVMNSVQPNLVLAQAATLPHQALSTAEIMKSTDRGDTWSATPTGLDGFSFVFDPRDAETVYGMAKKRLEPRLRAPFVRNLAGGSVLSPGSLFSIYGEDLAGGVLFDGQPAELSFVSARQVNGRVPSGLNTGPASVEVLVERGGVTAMDRQTVVLSDSAPVILPDAPVLHADGLRPVTAADPARPGERIVVYATGLGKSVAAQIWPTDRPIDVQQVAYVKPLQERAGVFEVGLELPQSLGEGSYLLLFWGGRNFARLPVARL